MNCLHEHYPCHKVLIDGQPVFDRQAGCVRPEIRCACLCKCPPCTELRLVRHATMGVPGFAPGIVWADYARVANRAVLAGT